MARKRAVDSIKKYFDIFIILKSGIPGHRRRVEEYFSYGMHGIYFKTDAIDYSGEQLKIMNFATELFFRGWVFAGTQNNKTKIKQLLSQKIIPVPSESDPKIIAYIKSSQSFKEISPRLKTVPLLDRAQCDYSLADRIRMKMLLETMNLRQKLMVKNVDDSFGSSGL